MKYSIKFWILFLLLNIPFIIYAQSGNTITRDTINLRGYIYDAKGKPVQHIRIESTQTYIDCPGFKITATTDSSGLFELPGIKPKDTLTIAKNPLYVKTTYINNGSRFIVIYMPTVNIIDINSQYPVQVVQQRLHAKAKAVFHTPDVYPQCEPPVEFYISPFFGGNSNNKARSDSAFLHFITPLIVYPQQAIKNNIEGTVQIGFLVERDGSLTDFTVLKGLGYGCDEAVITALKHSPKWHPAVYNAHPIAMKETVSVDFKLTDK